MRREGLRELRRRVAETEDADDTLVADSAFLLRFLRCKKFDVNRSFSVYQGYCRFRRDNADMLEDLDPHSVRHVWDGGVIGALSARDKKGEKRHGRVSRGGGSPANTAWKMSCEP